jgi:hypothetical protein
MMGTKRNPGGESIPHRPGRSRIELMEGYSPLAFPARERKIGAGRFPFIDREPTWESLF